VKTTQGIGFDIEEACNMMELELGEMDAGIHKKRGSETSEWLQVRVTSRCAKAKPS
jgi:hypothetical protein